MAEWTIVFHCTDQVPLLLYILASWGFAISRSGEAPSSIGSYVGQAVMKKN